MLLGKGILKMCSKLPGERPCQSAISKKLQSNFIKIALRHECSPLNLLLIFRTSFLKNTSGLLLLNNYTGSLALRSFNALSLTKMPFILHSSFKKYEDLQLHTTIKQILDTTFTQQTDILSEIDF